MTSKICRLTLALVLCASSAFASGHREAPIAALDHPADITDLFAFVNPNDPSKVVLILCVDPFLEPGNGPVFFPFDDRILYTIHIDNNHDAVEDITFAFQFTTEIREPQWYTALAGKDDGVSAPPNAPVDSEGDSTVGDPVVPPAITTLDGPGSEGLSLRQTYRIGVVTGPFNFIERNAPAALALEEAQFNTQPQSIVKESRTDRGRSITITTRGGAGKSHGGMTSELGAGQKLIAVPTNVGPRTMPEYESLASQGIYNLEQGFRVFAGTVDDPFYADLGAIFDTFNFRPEAFPSGTPGVLGFDPVLETDQDVETINYAPDQLSGYNVNCIALEVPKSLILATGQEESRFSPAATIGVWAATSRPKMLRRNAPDGRPLIETSGPFVQVQRMGNAWINALIVAMGQKNEWSASHPRQDEQFADLYLDPLVARWINALFEFPVAPPPRVDLLPLFQYLPPIAAEGTNPGPIADLLRLNTGEPPTPEGVISRLGLLDPDFGGYPNGRRVFDDVTDITLRLLLGAFAGPPFGGVALGDAVNANDVPFPETFPFVAFAQSGLEHEHYHSEPFNVFDPFD